LDRAIVLNGAVQKTFGNTILRGGCYDPQTVLPAFTFVLIFMVLVSFLGFFRIFLLRQSPFHFSTKLLSGVIFTAKY
jgi:hypothetical protein